MQVRKRILLIVRFAQFLFALLDLQQCMATLVLFCCLHACKDRCAGQSQMTAGIRTNAKFLPPPRHKTVVKFGTLIKFRQLAAAAAAAAWLTQV